MMDSVRSVLRAPALYGAIAGYNIALAVCVNPVWWIPAVLWVANAAFAERTR